MPKLRKTTIADLERLYNALLSRLDALELAFDIARRTQKAKGKRAKQIGHDLEKASQAVRAFSNAAFGKEGKAVIGKGLLPILVDGTPYGIKEAEARIRDDTEIVVGDLVEALDTAGTPLQPGYQYVVVQLLSTKALLLEDVRTKEQWGTYQLGSLKLVERKGEIGTARREVLKKDAKASLEKDKKRFPVGSLVRCVKSSDHLGDDDDVKEGLIYTVREHTVFRQPGRQWLELRLVGNPFNWATNRFEPIEAPKAEKAKPSKAKPKFKVGDVVEFARPNPPEALQSPIHVIRVRKDSHNHHSSLTVEDANGFRSAGWNKAWFKLVKPSKTKKGKG